MKEKVSKCCNSTMTKHEKSDIFYCDTCLEATKPVKNSLKSLILTIFMLIGLLSCLNSKSSGNSQTYNKSDVLIDSSTYSLDTCIKIEQIISIIT